MTAEIKVFSDPEELAAYLIALYGGGSTIATVTVLKPAVYLIQHD